MMRCQKGILVQVETAVFLFCVLVADNPFILKLSGISVKICTMF